MRFLLAVSLLAVACSTKTSLPDANDLRDTSADMSSGDTSNDVAAEHGGVCSGGYPCCVFESGVSSVAQCNIAQCIFPDAGGPPPDADSFGCGGCQTGYACAIVCPSPNGGCGPPAICCPVP